MSSEVIGEITLVSGNTHTRQRGSGHSVVPSTQSVSRLRAGCLRFGSRGESRDKPCGGGV